MKRILVVIVAITFSLYAQSIEQRLIEAVKKENIKEVKRLIQAGANINAKDKKGKTPLHFAAQQGNFELVKLLIENGADVNAKDNAWITPLHLAAYSNQVKVVRFLVEKGADVDASDYFLWRTYYYTTDSSLFNYLVKKSDFVESEYVLNPSPSLYIYIAAIVGDLNRVKKYSAHLKNINIRDSIFQIPLLHYAVAGGNVEVIKYLLSKGADINISDNDGITPIHIAAGTGQIEALKYLIENGADPTKKSNDGATALHFAASGGQFETAKYLVESGLVDVNIRDNDGNTPLHFAVKYGNSADLVRYLIDKGADMYANGGEGWTPIHEAGSSAPIEILKIFV